MQVSGSRFQVKKNEVADEVLDEEFAASNQYGMIFTFMWAFDQQADWDYTAHVRSIFEPYGTEFYYVELVAPQEIRLQRNTTENRLRNKASKRDIAASNARLLNDDQRYRCESLEGEIPFANYLRIDNSDIAPETVARIIQQHFDL